MSTTSRSVLAFVLAVVGVVSNGVLGAQSVDQRRLQNSSDAPQAPIDELQGLGEADEIGDVVPVGKPADLRGLRRLCVELKRYDLDADRRLLRSAAGVDDTSPLTQDRDDLVTLIATLLPKVRIVGTEASSEILLLVWEFHIAQPGSPDYVTTGATVYVTTDPDPPHLRRALSLGTFAGNAHSSLDSLASRFADAYERANK